MHARSALPCAWALGAVVALTGCATRALSPDISGDTLLLAGPAVAGPPETCALDAPPLPPSLEALRPAAPSIPVGRVSTVQPAIAAPCALPPDMSSHARAGSSTYDLPALHAQAVRRRDARAADCPGGT